MFKGGRFWTLHLADLGLMTMLQVADMVWEFPFNWYLRQIVDLFEKHPCRIPFLAQHCSRCCSFVSFAFWRLLLRSDVRSVMVCAACLQQETAAYLGSGMYHTMWRMDAGFAWDLQVKNDTLRETNITFENRPLPKEHFIFHQFAKGELLVSGRRVPPLIAIIAGLGSSWRSLNVVQAASVCAMHGSVSKFGDPPAHCFWYSGLIRKPPGYFRAHTLWCNRLVSWQKNPHSKAEPIKAHQNHQATEVNSDWCLH